MSTVYLLFYSTWTFAPGDTSKRNHTPPAFVAVYETKDLADAAAVLLLEDDQISGLNFSTYEVQPHEVQTKLPDV